MTFQEEHAAWLSTIYPGQPVYIPAAGLVEEAGELLHALLKREQEALWGKETRYADVDWFAKITDAIGDCAIYACSFCNAMKLDFEKQMNFAYPCGPHVPVASPITMAAQLIALGVAIVENPAEAGLVAYLIQLSHICKVLHLNIWGCLIVTWERVKKRSRT